MTEDMRVLSVPNRLTHKHCERCHGFSIWDVLAGEVDPPIIGGVLRVPQGGINEATP